MAPFISLVSVGLQAWISRSGHTQGGLPLLGHSSVVIIALGRDTVETVTVMLVIFVGGI